MNQDTKQYYRFAGLLPVMEDGPNAAPTMYPTTTLADSLEQARELAADAGLVLIGQLDTNNKLIDQ
jgi:hypothetical protein